MNNKQREERRLQAERRELEAKVPPGELTSPHRMCERECMDLKARMSLLESALARAGEDLLCMINCIDEELGVSSDNPTYQLIAEIDALLTPPPPPRNQHHEPTRIDCVPQKQPNL